MLPFQNHQTQNKYSTHYERRDDRVGYRLASAVGKKSWKWIAINLAWTAGPVTFIALQIGHYMGFGGSAPFRNFVYFAGYTVIAGVLAVVVSIVHDAFYRPKIERQQQQILESNDILLWVSQELRDRALAWLDPEARRIKAASYVLQASGASASAVGTAVMDMTQSIELTRAARNLQVYAAQGMRSRMIEIQAEIAPVKEQIYANLETIDPDALAMLDARLQGEAPRLRDGIARDDGFIERVLRAGEDHALHVMSYEDARHMVLLALELLSGRRIAVLDARLKGDDTMKEMQEQLDDARHLYRMALRKRNSHIHFLAEQLEVSIEEEPEDSLATTCAWMDGIVAALRAMEAKERTRYRKMYEAILQLNKALNTHHTRLLKTETRYAKRWQQKGHRLTLAIQSSDIKKAGFYIQERHISLNEMQKNQLAKRIGDIFPEEEYISLMEKKMKEKIIALANELDDLIDMSQPEEQLAIEASHAANFEDIAYGLALPTKERWARLAVDAMHENRRKAAHRLARNLVTYYRVPLTRPIIELMVEQFGAEEEHLTDLREDVAEQIAQDSALPTPPPAMVNWEMLVKS